MDIRHSKSFFGWNPSWECSPAPIGGQVDALFRINLTIKRKSNEEVISRGFSFRYDGSRGDRNVPTGNAR
jgi:hypothetical protein